MNSKILIAEDEEKIRRLVAYYLMQEAFTVIEAANGTDALALFEQHSDLALVILDVMMPGLDGYSVCKEIRRHSQLPVLMLTAKDTEPDELTGFRCGADEYVTKPFSPAILMQRVKNLLKRSGAGGNGDIAAGALQIRYRERTVLVDGSMVTLTPREFDLLYFLACNQGLVLSRDQILDRIWEQDYDGNDRTVDTHIKCLRAKLRRAGNGIITIRKVGYKLDVSLF
ncbi:MAG: response regulator transcription factor [Angelakisella sp.]